MRKLIAIASLLLLLPAVSQAKSLEDLLVEKGVITESEARASGTAGAKVYWNKGTKLEFPDTGFTAKIFTILQPRYQFTDVDGGENNSSFSVKVARLGVAGTAINKEFSYKLLADLVGTTNAAGRRAPHLLDAWIAWHPCDTGYVKMGQFKTRISRQFVTSRAKLQFPDRSYVSDSYALGRSQGVEAGWDFAEGRYELGGQFTNGESAGEGINRAGVDTRHTFSVFGRAGIMGELDPYSEGDTMQTEDLAWDVGGVFSYGEQTAATGFVQEATTVSVDTNMKYRGASVHGEVFWSDISEDTGPVVEDERIGFYVQGGYFVIPKKFEVALRFGLEDCDDGMAVTGGCSAGVEDITEYAASLNYFWWGHHLKAQLAWIHLEAQPVVGDDEKENRFIFQLSSWF